MPCAFPPLLAGEPEEDTGADQHDFEQDLEKRLSAPPMDGRRHIMFVVLVEFRQVDFRHRR